MVRSLMKGEGWGLDEQEQEVDDESNEDEDEVDDVEYDLRVEAKVGDVCSQPQSSSKSSFTFQGVFLLFLLILVSIGANLI